MTCLHQLFLTKVDAKNEDLAKVSRDLKTKGREGYTYRHLARCGLRATAMKESLVLNCSRQVDDVTLKFRREAKPVRRRLPAYLSSWTLLASNTSNERLDIESSLKL